ncbi:MAG TPA: hypothetical protein VHX61_18515 [Rhizomicrobium sp.]|jgi:hypothetical protein|nr:hypothetical protein [Rhizomicrobium sp.]
MKTNLLLATTAAVALTTGSAMATPPTAAFQGPRANPVVRLSPGEEVLYNQNSDPSYAFVNSQNYTSGVTADNDQAVDDFVVPTGTTWKVTEVDVTGCCAYTTSITENVTFYKDKKGAPGKLVKHGWFTGLSGTGNPSFAISLGKGVRLKAGHYWVSVVVNCNAGDGCGWGWGVRSTIENDPALWQNPGNGRGTGCTSWTTLETCFGSAYAGDFMFELQGKSK